MTNSMAYVLPGTTTTVDTIVTAVSNVCHVPIIDLYKKTHKRDIVEARGMVFFLVRKLLKHSLVETGRPFAMDHTTVLYWSKKTITLTRYSKTHRANFIEVCHRLGVHGETINNYLKEVK